MLRYAFTTTVLLRRGCLALAVLLSLANFAGADESSALKSFFNKHCVACHGPDEQTAGVRFDKFDGYKSADQHLWTMVYEVVASGEMPPAEMEQPTAAERKTALGWISSQASADLAATPGEQRRLNRREFSAALQDLTGLPIDFASAIAEDGKVDGFDTGAVALQDAADSVEQLLEVSRRAVDSIRFLEHGNERKLRIDFTEHDFTDFRKFVDQRYKTDGIYTKSKSLRCKQEVGLYLTTEWSGDRGNSFLALPAPADKRAALKLTLRAKVELSHPGMPRPILWVKIGGKYIDYHPLTTNPQTLSYAIRIEDHVVEDGVIKIMLRSVVETPYAVEGFENDDRSKPEDKLPNGIGVFRPKYDRKKLRTPDVQPVPATVLEWIEIDYDHQALWPPSDWATDLGSVSDNDESALRLLNLWMERAWRRPVSESEQSKFAALYRQLRQQGTSFENALRATFQSVLMGGPFRYIASPADDNSMIAQHAIASRLSFMLTGSPPDEELRRLAEAGKLREPQVLDTQVGRLLSDPRSEQFFEPFVMQWLEMDQPITVTMSHSKEQYFRFGRHLKDSLKQETVQYVAQLFRDNHPAAELVSSNWTMMNDILAVHYGYEPLDGGQLRKVQLKPDDPRGGGILSHAGIQSMLCWMGDNWVIYRGAWALKHILDDPPPPPPLEVPELSPFDNSNRGKTFRELLVQHQEDKNCTVCHRKMDPLGFAFQNFDISGRWRAVEHERYERSELDGKITWHGTGKTRSVDTTGQLPRGEQFETYAEFKTLLATHYLNDIVRGLLKKLTLYGTGRKPNVVDLQQIGQIMQQHKSQRYPLRDVLKSFVKSPIFLGR